MRNLKFRVWVDDSQRFNFLPSIFNMPDPCYTGEIQQFTGLVDKSGVEIYEGDRLACYVNDEEIGNGDRVQFKEGEFRLANRNRSLREWLYIEELDGREVECNFEVVGNIHEHPELLEAK
jgi:uncharacterized phage protein (TIGR01671 family)